MTLPLITLAAAVVPSLWLLWYFYSHNEYFLRALTAVPGHAIDGVLWGYYIEKALYSHSGRTLFMIQSLVDSGPAPRHRLYLLESWAAGPRDFDILQNRPEIRIHGGQILRTD
jgi:hypothetical protein